MIHHLSNQHRTQHAVFSIATNGYDQAFSSCLHSQYLYCRQLNVPYFLIRGNPPWGISAHDSAWLKIFGLQFLLKHFHGGVLYLDADCEVLPRAPDFRSLDSLYTNKSIFAGVDFSSRLNAAVIYCRSTIPGRRLMSRLAWSVCVPAFFLPRADRNLYENGHFIWICKNDPSLHILPQPWNSGVYRDVDLPFIIHHGGTQMRLATGENPQGVQRRFLAAFTSLRIPLHLPWMKSFFQQPLDEWQS